MCKACTVLAVVGNGLKDAEDQDMQVIGKVLDIMYGNGGGHFDKRSETESKALVRKNLERLKNEVVDVYGLSVFIRAGNIAQAMCRHMMGTFSAGLSVSGSLLEVITGIMGDIMQEVDADSDDEGEEWKKEWQDEVPLRLPPGVTAGAAPGGCHICNGTRGGTPNAKQVKGIIMCSVCGKDVEASPHKRF